MTTIELLTVLTCVLGFFLITATLVLAACMNSSLISREMEDYREDRESGD